jgi:hypothetical protein
MPEKIKFPNDEDIDLVLKKYQQLHYEHTEYTWKLSGSIDIKDKEGNYYDDYDIEIVGTLLFPNRFPKLFELSNKFPKTPEWHTYVDKSCCTAVWQKEIEACHKGITILGYMDEYVIPYLANQKYKKVTGQYKNGEYAHNVLGELQCFEEMLKTKSNFKIFTSFRLALSSKKIDYNKKCFCKSGKKYKNCHQEKVERLKALGIDYLNGFILRLKNSLPNS